MPTEVEELKDRILQIEAALADLRKSTTSRQEEERESAFESLIAEAQTIDPKLASSPSLIIAMRPLSPKEVPNLFSASDTGIVQLLENGVQERVAGFGLSQAYSHPRVVRGLYRSASAPGHDLRIVTKEATCIFIAFAGSKFLSWAMPESIEQLKLNPIGLVEYVYSTAIFVLKVANLSALEGTDWELLTDWANVAPGGKQLVLPTSRVNTMGFLMGLGHPVEEHTLRTKIRLTLPGLADVLAYKILKCIFNQAGATDAAIPYVVKGEEKIDVPGLLQG